MKNPLWTNEEIVRLKKEHSFKTWKELVELFPGRTKIAIQTKSERLGLYKKPVYEDIFVSESQKLEFTQIIEGSLLGDCHLQLQLSKKAKNAAYKQRCKHSNFLKTLINIFNKNNIHINNIYPKLEIAYLKATQKEYEGYYFVSPAHKLFTEQHCRWYFNKVKFVPQDLELSPLAVKYWYYGDGGLNYRYHRITALKLATNNFILNDVEFLCEQLKNILNTQGIYPTKVKNNKYIIQINKSIIPSFLEYIGPCDAPCYMYKFIIDNRELYDYHKIHCPCNSIGKI